MSESTIKLLNLINEGKTVNEISDIMGLSNKAIYGRINMLKNAGYNFKRIYYSDGNIVYSNGFDAAWYNERENGVNLMTKDTAIEAIAVSDLHFGSVYEFENIMDKIYDYCIKNNIHIIFFGGDLVDGNFGFDKKINNIDEQIDYLLEKYPFDKSILNFGVLGNHDYSIYKENSRDLSLILNNYRHDIVPLGYYVGRLNIGNDQLLFEHGSKSKYLPGKSEIISSEGNISKYIVLKGHSHGFLKVIDIGGNVFINIPPTTKEYGLVPSITKIRLRLQNGLFQGLLLNQILVDKDFNTINEFIINFSSKKKNNYCNLFGNINPNQKTSTNKEFIDDGKDSEACKPKSLVKKL